MPAAAWGMIAANELAAVAVLRRRGGGARHARRRAALDLAAPLSRQLRALEDELGQPLFERRGRGIVLTAFGRHFATKATAILDHVASVLADSKRWPS